MGAAATVVALPLALPSPCPLPTTTALVVFVPLYRPLPPPSRFFLTTGAGGGGDGSLLSSRDAVVMTATMGTLEVLALELLAMAAQPLLVMDDKSAAKAAEEAALRPLR